MVIFTTYILCLIRRRCSGHTRALRIPYFHDRVKCRWSVWNMRYQASKGLAISLMFFAYKFLSSIFDDDIEFRDFLLPLSSGMRTDATIHDVINHAPIDK